MDKEESVSKSTEQDANDTTADERKVPEASASEVEKQTTEGDEPSKGEVRTTTEEGKVSRASAADVDQQTTEVDKPTIEGEEPRKDESSTKETTTEEGKVSEASTSQVDKPTTEGEESRKEGAETEDGPSETKDSSSEEKIDGAVKQGGTEAHSPEESEKVFSPATQERLLGLLGAILPQDSKVGPKLGGHSHRRTQLSAQWEEQIAYSVTLGIHPCTGHDGEVQEGLCK